MLNITTKLMNHKIVPYEKSLFVKNKPLTKLFHPTLNKKYDPKSLNPYSKEVFIWWKCKVNPNHLWKSSPYIMNKKKSHRLCSHCNKYKKWEKLYLIDSYPDLVDKFDFSMNGDIDYFTIRLYSSKKLFLKCRKNSDHILYVSPKNFRYKCYKCKLEKNNLAVKLPELAKEFHPTKNGNVTPKDINYSSHKEYWWICKNKHEFKISPNYRYKRNRISECQMCKLEKNNIAVKLPEYAKEFHPTKNGNITPKDIYYGSHKEYWWICKNKHEFKSSPNDIYQRELISECRICKIEMNNLAIKLPELAKEFHPTKNGKITPKDIYYSSHKEYWWICKNMHEFKSSPNDRYQHERISECQICKLEKNNLAVKLPELAKEFHPTKNGNTTPTDIYYGSCKEYWWMCKNKHEFKSSPHERRIYLKIINCRKCKLEKNNLAIKLPELAKEFHPIKNGNTTPTDIYYGSCKEYWWMCKNNHEFKSSPSQRFNKEKIIKCVQCKLQSYYY